MDLDQDSDFDFFFASADQFAAFVKDMEQRSAIKKRETETNITFTLPAGEKQPELMVQAIRVSYFPTLAEMLDTFDFSLCQCGYDGESYVFGEFTLFDLARRRLVPGRISYGVSSLRRMIKYTRQGYTICSGGMANLLEQIAANPAVINHNTPSLD
jgi:hypothetical protein